MLLDNRKLFLSKRAINSFGGYADAQLRRLQNALARDSFPQNEKEQHIFNSVKNAMKGYREINMRGLKLVKPGGYFATCSCSHFMTPELFTEVIGQAARSVHKRLKQVEYRTQAPDHPILWSSEESYYLKFYIFQVCEDA